MPWDSDTLNWVYDRTDGYCRYCERKVYWRNYGKPAQRGAWEVDHSVPLALGGTDYLSNLWPACTACNRDKGARTGSQYKRLLNDAPVNSASGGSVFGDLAALFLFVLFLKAFQK